MVQRPSAEGYFEEKDHYVANLKKVPLMLTESCFREIYQDPGIGAGDPQ